MSRRTLIYWLDNSWDEYSLSIVTRPEDWGSRVYSAETLTTFPISRCHSPTHNSTNPVCFPFNTSPSRTGHFTAVGRALGTHCVGPTTGLGALETRRIACLCVELRTAVYRLSLCGLVVVPTELSGLVAVPTELSGLRELRNELHIN